MATRNRLNNREIEAVKLALDNQRENLAKAAVSDNIDEAQEAAKLLDVTNSAYKKYCGQYLDKKEAV